MAELTPRPNETDDQRKRANEDWRLLEQVLCVCASCGAMQSSDPPADGAPCWNCAAGRMRRVRESDLDGA